MPIPIQTITTPRFTMDYFTFGTGKTPCVILPGASIRSVMLSADAVAALYGDFIADFTFYVFDKKRDMQTGYDAFAMAEDTAEAMELLGIHRACVFGASLGGMMAQCLAAYHPALVKKLALCSTLLSQNDTSRTVLDRWIRLADSGDALALDRDVWARIYSPSYYQKYQTIFESMTGKATPEEIRQFAVQIRACRSFDGQNQIHQIRCPVLVVGTRDDLALSGDSSPALAKALGCPLYLYEGYGHAVYDEAPDYPARMMAFFAD